MSKIANKNFEKTLPKLKKTWYNKKTKKRANKQTRMKKKINLFQPLKHFGGNKKWTP